MCLCGDPIASVGRVSVLCPVPSSVKHLRVLSEPNGFEHFERFLNDSERSNFIFELNRDLVWVVVAGPLDIAEFGIAI